MCAHLSVALNEGLNALRKAVVLEVYSPVQGRGPLVSYGVALLLSSEGWRGGVGILLGWDGIVIIQLWGMDSLVPQ